MPKTCAPTAASILWMLAACMFSPSLLAQKKDDEKWRIDPFTKAKPAAMKRAGVVGYGPFPLEKDHGSHDLHKMFPEAKFLWLETAHFRIGSSLKSLPIPQESVIKKQLFAEIKLLKKRLPKLKPKPKVISRWLLLHLYAFRMERMHADFLKLIRRREQEFPSLDKVSKDEMDHRFMGRGPQLGMQQKFTLLLFAKENNMARYGKKAGIPVDEQKPHPIFRLTDHGSLLFGTSSETITHQTRPGHRLHANVLFNMTQTLLQGYKYYSHRCPSWIEEGLGNVFVRRMDPEEHDFSGMKDWNTSKAYPTNWEAMVRNLVGSGYAPKVKDLVQHMASKELSFNAQMCAWSLCDFLVQYKGGKPLAAYLDIIKRTPKHEVGTLPDAAAVLALQEQARKEALKMSWDELEAAWIKYARRAYKKK